jgi:hypothetical protein
VVEALERPAKLDDAEAAALRPRALLPPGFPAQKTKNQRNVGVVLELRERGEVGEREQAGVAGEAVEPVVEVF